MRSDNCVIPLCCRLIKLESRSMQSEIGGMGRLKREKREGWVMWCMQCHIWENIWEMLDNYIVCHIFEHIVSISFSHLLMKITVTCLFLADWSYINYSFQPWQISYGTAIVVKYIKGHVDIIGLHTHISRYWSRVTSTIFSFACFPRFYFNTLPNPMAYCWMNFYETFLCTYLFELRKQWNIANLLMYR